MQQVFESTSKRSLLPDLLSCLVAGAVLVLAPLTPAQEARVGNVAAKPAQELLSDTKIITIQYRCPAEHSVGGTCSAAVTKGQFDALVQALDPNMTAQNRQALASEYARLLIMAAEARRRSLERSPEVQTLLQFSMLQLLSNQLVREITTKRAPVSESDVEQYFRDHRRDYYEVTLSRIRVPLQTAKGAPPAQELAQATYKRALAGENFDALQGEINGVPGETPTKLAPLRCRLLPEAHRQACDLESGQVSLPLPDDFGYAIYRLESRRIPTLDDLRQELRETVEQQRLEQELHQVRTPVSLQLDERYFGNLPATDLAVKHGLQDAANVISPSKPSKAHHHH